MVFPVSGQDVEAVALQLYQLVPRVVQVVGIQPEGAALLRVGLRYVASDVGTRGRGGGRRHPARKGAGTVHHRGVVLHQRGHAHQACHVPRDDDVEPGWYVGAPLSKAVQVEDEHSHGHGDGSEDHDDHQIHT